MRSEGALSTPKADVPGSSVLRYDALGQDGEFVGVGAMPVKPAVEIAHEEFGVAAMECRSKYAPLSIARRASWSDIDVRAQPVQGLYQPEIGLMSDERIDGAIV
jgi:hypothetical protein